ncbi:MAG: InlB B-repeat-containing protein, partial [Peptoniphilus grossensis]
FTAANELAFDNAGSFWPIITRDGQIIGQEGSPYKAEVRFNQSLNKIWPKDEEVSNLPPGSSDPEGDTGLIGWIINNNAGETIFRDTPPYRLSAEDFIDAEDVMSEEDLYGYGHSDQIPIKDGQTKTRDKYEISLGSTSLDTAVVHHIDIIKDDFDGKEQIDYDMSYWKSDTNAVEYPFILPHLQGFTLKETNREAEWVLEESTDNNYRTINDLNRERNKITPFRSDADKIKYIPKFPWGTKLFKGKNAYNYANYTRNKYKLKLNNDPKTIKNDNEYTDGKDRFDVFYERPLNDLQLDANNKPERPDWVPKNWEFKGWATDPAGENLLKDGKETKLHYDQFLFAKWGEPDYKWKVTIDPDGGTMKNITVEDLIFRRNEYQDINKSAVKEANDGNKQIFTVNHREKLNKVQAPKRKGYDFLGWQVIRYNADGSVDTSYRKEYGVPELYAFGNDVVGDVYIKAIWLANNKIDVPVFHHFIDKDGNEIGNPKKFVIEDARAKYYTAATATEQNQDWILMPHEELMDLPDENKVKQDYIKYNEHHKFDNTDIHSLKVEPLFILGEDGDSIPNPKAEFNEFHFYYRRFKTRDYKVNYLDKKAKDKIDEIMAGTGTLD